MSYFIFSGVSGLVAHAGHHKENRVVADVWEKDVWDFQAKSGSSGSCRLCLHFRTSKMSGQTPGSSRHPFSRHPQPSEPKEKAK